MMFHHAGKYTDHHQTDSGWLGELALGGCFDTILYSWQCFWVQLLVSQSSAVQSLYSRKFVQSFFFLLPTSGKLTAWKRNGECYHESSVVLTVNILRLSMCGVASHPRDWTHSQFCPKTLPKNGINMSSKCNFSQWSKRNLGLGSNSVCLLSLLLFPPPPLWWVLPAVHCAV